MRKIRLIFLTFLLTSSCLTIDYEGQPTSIGIHPKLHTTVSVDPSAPIWLVENYKVAISIWNDVVGVQIFEYTDDFQNAYIKVYNELEATDGNKEERYIGMTNQTGCMMILENLPFECKITMYLPNCLTNPGTTSEYNCTYIVAEYQPLFKVDKYLKPYFAHEVMDYVRDKYSIQVAVHELGHTIGLDHNADPTCSMYPSTSPYSFPCEKEIKAIKHLLKIEE